MKKARGFRDILFLNKMGKSLSRVMIFNIIKETALRAGLNKVVSPHTFRHSFASHLVNGGADIRTVQDMLGHESILTTEIYTHLDNSYLRDTITNFHPERRNPANESLYLDSNTRKSIGYKYLKTHGKQTRYIETVVQQ